MEKRSSIYNFVKKERINIKPIKRGKSKFQKDSSINIEKYKNYFVV